MKKELNKHFSKVHITKPLLKKEEIITNPGNKINDNFPGGKAKTKKSYTIDEQQSDGSANAFEGTEKVEDDD